MEPDPALPGHVAVSGAAGSLGQGILSVCRAEGCDFTAIVRSRVVVFESLADGALTGSFVFYALA